MKLLVACEYSGIVREAFAKKGFDAWSCDLLQTEIPSNKHLVMDNDMHLKDTLYKRKWDIVIGHPPCTFLCNSAALRLYINSKKENGIDPCRWQKMKEAALFFKMILNCPVANVVIENPVPHGYALGEIGMKYNQTIQPYNFNGDASKRTCLWITGGGLKTIS